MQNLEKYLAIKQASTDSKAVSLTLHLSSYSATKSTQTDDPIWIFEVKKHELIYVLTPSMHIKHC